MVLTWVTNFTNQSLTLEQFITDLRINIYEDVADVITDEQIGRWIIAGLEDISLKTGLLPEYCEVACDGSTSYALPAGLLKIKSVEYIQENSITYVKNTNRSVINEEGLTGNTGSITHYIREGNNIFVYGQPSTGTLRINGVRIPSAPVDNSDYIDLPPEYMNLLKMYCEWRYWKRRRDLEEAAYSYKDYYEAIRDTRVDVIRDYGKGGKLFGKPAYRNNAR